MIACTTWVPPSMKFSMNFGVCYVCISVTHTLYHSPCGSVNVTSKFGVHCTFEAICVSKRSYASSYNVNALDLSK